jgi:hypothetical protein
MAEAAIAIALVVTKAVRPVGDDGKPAPLGRALALMLGARSQCAAALGKRVIVLSDITLWLSDIGVSWERIGANFPAAQDELEQQKTGLFVTVLRRAHMILCSAAHSPTIYCADGNVAEVAPAERDLVRASFEARLNTDWPSYITRRWQAHNLLHDPTSAYFCGSFIEPQADRTHPRTCLNSGYLPGRILMHCLVYFHRDSTDAIIADSGTSSRYQASRTPNRRTRLDRAAGHLDTTEHPVIRCRSPDQGFDFRLELDALLLLARCPGESADVPQLGKSRESYC